MFLSASTSHRTTEIIRRLDNLLRIGEIKEIDYSTARCRIKSGGLVSDWLPWLTLRAGQTRTWNPPTIGEHVVILSLSGELNSAIVLLGLNSPTFAAPSHDKNETVTDYPDGARIVYNHKISVLHVSGIKTATIQAQKQVTINCPNTLINGNVSINGELILNGAMTQQGGSLTSNGIIFAQHTHSGIKTGEERTGSPQ